MKELILVINAGSSSLKYALFNQRLSLLCRGSVDRIGQTTSAFNRVLGTKRKAGQFKKAPNHRAALSLAIAEMKRRGIRIIDIGLVGHRVVHGGHFARPKAITDQAFKTLERLVNLAPRHQPANLMGIRIARRLIPKAKHIAVFDTAFFSKLPQTSSIYPINRVWAFKPEFRRYGFHGTSHEWAMKAAGQALNKPVHELNLITLHLGAGCSAAAIRKGQPIDTSMGLTPLEGLMMATRSGDIDPGLILKLLRSGFNVDKVDYLLNHQSGWFGLTGREDLRDVLTAAGHRLPSWPAQGDWTGQQKKSSRLAVNLFVNRITKYIGAYAALLGKVDALVFTGAIGSGNSYIRQMIRRSSPLIRKMKCLVVTTDEERAIAEAIRRVH